MSFSGEVELPPNMSCLKPIDTMLRCPICFDFLNITMMSPCSHNFCSLCIRKFLSYKLLCPVCNTSMTEQDLRNNRLLDDLVQSFQTAKQQLCQGNFDSPPISPKTPSVLVQGKLARRKGLGKEGSATLTHFFQKRPPRNLSAGSKTDPSLPYPVKEEPVEVCMPCPPDLQQEPSAAETTALKEEEMDVSVSPSTSQTVKQAVVKVECPVCGLGVSQHHVNKHLDMCLNRDEKKDGLRSSAKRRPMPKLVYTLLSIAELKKKLRECHLSTQGSKEQLIKRHQEFTYIYNSQCDSLNPRSSEDIAKEVETNEKTRNQLENKKKPAIVITKNQTAEEIEQLNSKYRKQHSGEFSQLIAQVRGRMEKSKRKQIKQEEKTTVESCSTVNHTPVQITAQTPVSMALKEVNDETASVIEISSRSSSPTLSDVSVSSSVSDVFN